MVTEFVYVFRPSLNSATRSKASPAARGERGVEVVGRLHKSPGTVPHPHPLFRSRDTR
jgi:hypothetical protein